MPMLAIPPVALFEEPLAMTAVHGLLALMIHPTEEKARREIIETLAVRDIGSIHLDSEIEIAAMSITKQRINYPKSERLIVAEGRSYREVRKEMHSPELNKEWQSVISLTAIFLTLQKYHADMPGGVSLNKALNLMELSPRHRKYGHQNVKYVRKAWNTYKNIAHVLIAYALINAHGYDKHFIYTCAGLSLWLGCARSVQQQVLSIETKNNQQKQLIDAENFWFVPDDIPLPSISLEFPPLNNAEIEKMGIKSPD